MSLFPLPSPPAGESYTNFCNKGGRFGPHNTNLEQHLPDVEKQGDLIYLTYFNAGLRIFDIKDPRMPRETGWFIPPTPPKRFGPIPAKLVTQTEDVLVDTRGNVYITDFINARIRRVLTVTASVDVSPPSLSFSAAACGTPVVASNLPGVRQPVRMTGMGEVVPVEQRDVAEHASDSYSCFGQESEFVHWYDCFRSWFLQFWFVSVDVLRRGH
jgi:hypothetical protein